MDSRTDMNEHSAATDCSTPPWSVDDLGETHFELTNHRYGIGADQATIYRVAKVEGSGGAAMANARLISAAPELLEACNAARPVLCELRNNAKLIGAECRGIEERIALIDAAVDKATLA